MILLRGCPLLHYSTEGLNDLECTWGAVSLSVLCSMRVPAMKQPRWDDGTHCFVLGISGEPNTPSTTNIHNLAERSSKSFRMAINTTVVPIYIYTYIYMYMYMYMYIYIFVSHFWDFKHKAGGQPTKGKRNRHRDTLRKAQDLRLLIPQTLELRPSYG